MNPSEKIEAKKSLGQHFLTSDIVPKWMANAGEVQPGDTVVEIGSGTGVLTRELLARGARVLGIETDPRAEKILRSTFLHEIEEGTFTLLSQDARLLDFATLGLSNHSFKVIANIPYYLSGLLFRVSLSGIVQPSLLVFLVQKEVAKRALGSSVGGAKESLLSLSIKLYGEPSYIREVSKGHFTPSPKVDSAILCVRNISRARLAGIDEEFFFTILKLGFGSKRKQLLGNLSKEFPRETLIHTFSTCGIDSKVRGEDLDLETWLRLARELSTN